MECWSELVAAYPENPEPKDLAKALSTADILLSSDLAPFEIEWFAETFLYKPIDLFNTIVSKKVSEDWFKNIADAFKIIAKISAKYWNLLEKENRQIVELCLLPFDAQTRKNAILCLSSILKNPGVDVGDAKRLVNVLEAATTCKAPLALLIGNICRYYPETVDQEFTRIWRIYLKMLQPENRTDTVVSAVLQGIDGLFENFGRDLPLQELNDFYKDFSRKCAKISKCIEPLLSILKSHAGLFKEMLTEDQVLRSYLWGINHLSVKETLLAVYTVIFEDAMDARIRTIIKTEIEPKMNSESSLIKHTALRILIYVKKQHKIRTPNMYRPDYLEYQLRKRTLSYQETELVSLFLESGEAYVTSLLITAINFYGNIPVALRKGLVVEGILRVYDKNREDRDGGKVILSKLIELSRQDGALEKYADVWRGLLDTDRQNKEILNDAIEYIAGLLKSSLESSTKDISLVLSLSSLLSFVLCVSETTDVQYIKLLKPIVEELSVCLCITPFDLLSSKFVCEEMFKENAVLKELLVTKKDFVYNVDALSVLQILLSGDAEEPKVLIKALSAFSNQLDAGKYSSHNQRHLSYVKNQIEKLKSRKDTLTSDRRTLLRDISMFLGKHGSLLDKDNFTKNINSMEMKNKITITIPNVAEGTSYKIDLLSTLHVSLSWGDGDILYCLLVLLCANLRDRPDPSLQSITWNCIHAVLRSNSSVDLTPALQMSATYECVQQAIDLIINETDPEVRRVLCDCLQVQLILHSVSESHEELLTLLAYKLFNEYHFFGFDISNLNSIDIARVFLNTSRHNDDLIIKYLPKIILALSITNNKSIFKTAADIFIEKIDIFKDGDVKNLIFGVIGKLKQCFSTNSCFVLEFIKMVFDVRSYDYNLLIEEICNSCFKVPKYENEHFENKLLMLTTTKPMFVLDKLVSKHAINMNDSCIIKKIYKLLNTKLYKEQCNEEQIEILRNILKFLKEFAEELLEEQKEITLQCLNLLTINTMNHESVIPDLSTCISTYKTILTELPEEIKNTCIENLPFNIQEINEKLSEVFNMTCLSFYMDKLEDSLRLLYTISNILDVPIDGTKYWTYLVRENEEKLPQLSLDSELVSKILYVSEKTLTASEFVTILSENSDFVRKYLSVYIKRILVMNDLVLNKHLFVNVVKYFVNNYKIYEHYYDNIMKLLENTWPKLEEDFQAKLTIASEFFKLPRQLGSIPPVEWMMNIITSPDTSIDDKTRMVIMLPGGDEFSGCYRHIAGMLPTRLSEVRGDHAAVFRALLDSLAVTGDLTLLDIIITLAAGDDTKGWWDDAIEVCMTSLAAKQDEKIYDAGYRACKKTSGLGGCRRVFVPLLRYSSRSFCEEYMSKIITDVLSTFKTGFKEPTNTEIYKDRILSYAKAFVILQIAIEKIPVKNLESGIINSSAGSQDPWYVVKELCKYSVTLRDKVRCPDNATDAIREAFLHLQCSAYNCLTNAICKRKPSQKQYTIVFDVNAWSKIVDPDVEYEFLPRAYWGDNQVTKKSDSSVASSSSFTGTVRTRLFMGTLSENPLQYDMIPYEEEEDDIEEDKPLVNENHPLNSHGCLSVISGLLQHASCLDHSEWLSRLVHGLKSNLPVNSKWMIAQAICNTEADLVPHAITLAPALLELVSTTAKTSEGCSLLNNLHIDIIWTVLKWNIPELSSYDALNTCLEGVISTCIEYRSKEAVSKRLLNTLTRLLQVYSAKIQIKWHVFEKACKDLPSSSSYLLPIFQRILQKGVPLPNLLPILKNLDSNQWIQTSRLAEVFGLALSLETDKERFLVNFWQTLASVKAMNIRRYVSILQYAQRNCPQCCNEQIFRIITDLTPKAETARCLSIISVYLDNMVEDNGVCAEMFQIIALEEMLEGPYMGPAMKVVQSGFKFMTEALRDRAVRLIVPNTRNNSIAVRKQALQVILKVFQDLVIIKEEPSVKRRALQSTLILDTISSQGYHRLVVEEVARGLLDKVEEIALMMRDGVDMCLSKDMAVRFAELFYIIFYFIKSDTVELCEYGSIFLDLLFSDVKQQDGYKNLKISEHALPTIDSNIGDATLTLGRIAGQKQSSIVSGRPIDVQMPVADMFEVFLKSAKGNSQICQELCVQMMKRLQGSGRRFDLDDVIAKLLADMLKKEPSCLTPLLLEASRIFVNSVYAVTGFTDSIEVLKKKVITGDSLAYCNVLYEDLLLRSKGRKLFDFSIKEESDIEMRDENLQFSIEGLIKTFGDLANWDDLRIQDKRCIEESLPPLIVQRMEFEKSLEKYFEERKRSLDYKLWFNKMAGSYFSNKLGETVIEYKENWFKDIERWPARDFVKSSVIEAVKWYQDEAEMKCDIPSADCLAEWSARLMIRSAFIRGDVRKSDICRGDELKLCIEANRRELPYLALQCIERNKNSLLETEAMSWFDQRVLAQRTIALKKNDTYMLQQALKAAEQHGTDANLSLNNLILQLRHDLGLITKTTLEDIFQKIDPVPKSSAELKSIADIALNYYDDLWDSCTDVASQTVFISDLTSIIDRIIRWHLTEDCNLVISLLIYRLSCFESMLSDDIAEKVLYLMQSFISDFDTYTKDQFKSIIHVFPRRIWSIYINEIDIIPVDTCRMYLRLICDPQYALLQYCDKLLCAKDSESWKVIFNAMKTNLFSNPYGGTDYISLNSIKNKLISIEHAGTAERQSVLTGILDDLRTKAQRSVLRFSQLSPELTKPAILEKHKYNLKKLLYLPSSVDVVKFSEQVHVFKDSIRRPCVICVTLSNGRKKRYIIKTGEPLGNDASVQRAIAILPKLTTCKVRSYNVTTLFEDAAIIEYLEDHERLRELMGDIVNIPVNRLADDKLVLSPSLALEEHNAMCNKVPPYTLRCAIENRCASVEEFINKKNMFLETLATMTITNWIFGVGDRHLQNILLSTVDGAVCCVDWASVFQFGVREFVPARLTDNILAVCNLQVLESRLQRMLECLRRSQKIYEAYIRTSFYWKENDFEEITYISNILKGKSVSYEITRDVINNSKLRLKDEYIKMLDTVFENFNCKPLYTVEEQVSCLLQHCTSPKLLSITPRGWEAWV